MNAQSAEGGDLVSGGFGTANLFLNPPCVAVSCASCLIGGWPTKLFINTQFRNNQVLHLKFGSELGQLNIQTVFYLFGVGKFSL